jgi:hypothetical protein
MTGKKSRIEIVIALKRPVQCGGPFTTFRNRFPELELEGLAISTPNSGEVEPNSAEYEARVGIDRLLARYQLLIEDCEELFKLISEYFV